MNVPGYDLEGEISTGLGCSIYRGRRQRDGHPILAKVVAPQADAEAVADRLEWEYEITRHLPAEGVVPVHDLVPLERGRALILEDTGALPLRAAHATGPLEPRRAMTIGLQLASVLGSIHRHQFVHKAIHPCHLFIRPESGEVSLTGFVAASRLSDEKLQSRHHEISIELLPYQAPEQTGRMNRRVGRQADLYALGVVLYELLTGRVPFEADDPLELIHAHIAIEPQSPLAIRPELPAALSQIVLKLLAKAAEDRYQSAIGLHADLEACLDGDVAADWTPGLHDVSDLIEIPEKLYGRERELDVLMHTFDRVAGGATELLLVSGYSGVGKSALVSEVHRPIVRRRGYFISGKFDQFQRNIPHSAVISAFQELTRQLLTESQTQIAAWRALLEAALGTNGQVITAVIPEIELIIGPQPPVPELPPAETKNRFNLVFERFIRVFAQAEHPLVVFLDDLQWADSATLTLLQALATDPTLRHLLIIGAYRDNEVGSGHPLAQTLAELETSEALVGRIRLTPLRREDLIEFVADTFRCSTDEAAPFAELVHEKTDGNPFFVIQFIKILGSEGVLYFDYQEGRWAYDLDGIRSMGITDNVVDLMVRKIGSLSDSTQNIVKLAACIGNRFDLATLAIVREVPPEQAASELSDAVLEGLILPNSKVSFRLAELGGSTRISNPETATYRFLHDRVQQAAYALIPDDSKQVVHLQVGTLMWRHRDAGTLDEHLFEIVGHLNIGASLIDDGEERIRLAALNLRAGRKAKSSTAYRPALTFLEAGIELLPADPWSTHYDLAFALYLECAEASYLCGYLERAELELERLLERARSPIDKAEIYRMRIVQYENTSRFPEARDWGKTGLALFDIVFPEGEDERQEMLEGEMGAIGSLIGNREIAELAELPVMTDEAMRISMKLLMTMWAPAYISGDMTLTAMIAAKMVHLSLTYGNVEESAYGYVTYGATVGLRKGDYASSHGFGRLALEINKRFDDLSARAKVNHMFSCYIGFWREPIASCFPYSREAHLAGLSSGDFIYSAYGVYHESWHALFRGQPLDEYDEHYAPYLEFMTRTKNQTFYDAHQQVLALGRALQGRTESPSSFSSADFDEAGFLETYKALGFFISIYYVTKLQLLYLLGDYEEAARMADEAERLGDKTEGMIWDAWRCFYQALNLAACHRSLAAPRDRAAMLIELERLVAQMEIWARNSPSNFSHRHDLVAAEAAAIRGDVAEAMAAYERAIADAARHGFIQIEALANECYGRFWLERGNDRVAKLYLRAAAESYGRWGAVAKVEELRARYPLQLPPAGRDETDTALDVLDLKTVMRAAQVISGEVEQHRLRDQLLRIAMENAGAQRGCLLIERDGELRIEAESSVTEGLEGSEQTPGESVGPGLAQSIVHYVERVGKSVVLADATRDDRFSNDLYVQKERPRSLLCVPILHQGKPLGMLYLENNLVRGAFTPDRIEVVKILASQAAISLENARLYEEMKTEIAERKQAEAALRKVAEITAPVTGSDYFDSLVRHLATDFGVRYAFVAQCGDAPDLQAQTVSFWNGGDLGENFSYAVAGTPCEQVLNGEVCHLPDRVQELFPTDAGLVALEAQSYLGIPLHNASGKIIGHIAVLDDKPMPRRPHDISILNIFAARAAAELERKHGEEALQRAHDDLERRVAERTEELSRANERLHEEILERAQIEERLQEAKNSAEAANRAKSDFLASMSHELRTPLNAILGYAQILQRDKGLTDSHGSAVGVIERSGEHLLTLINDILSLSKIEAGKLEASLCDFNLHAFLGSVIEIARVRVEQKGLAFRYETTSPLPTAVQCDERWLRQILLNLLSNAAKFTDQGGVVLRVGYHPESTATPCLVFEVEDTGIGISPGDLEEIFEPFLQVHGADRREEGTGLGLAISKRLVQLMGGRIDVRSTPGRGSVFSVLLALPELPLAGGTSSDRRITGHAGPVRRILVVDDRPANRAVVVGLLAPLGFELEEAENGREAIAKARESRPHLVLMDLVMPVMDGFEATRRIRRARSLRDTVVVALSASVFEHNRKQSLDAGCHDFIPKPVKAGVLLDKLKRHLGLEWTHEEVQPTIPSAEVTSRPTLVSPPLAAIETLYELATIGDIQGMLKRLDEIEGQGDPLLPFVTEMRRLAARYEMQQMTELLASYLNGADEHETG